jgi:hypothetical protein
MQATDLVVALRRQRRLFQRLGVLLHAFLALFESPARLQASHLSVPHTTLCSGEARGEQRKRHSTRRRPSPPPEEMPGDALVDAQRCDAVDA